MLIFNHFEQRNAFSPYVFHDTSRSLIIPNASAIRNADTVNFNPKFAMKTLRAHMIWAISGLIICDFRKV